MSDQKYVVRVNMFLRKIDFEKYAEEMKARDPNIIVLPPHVDLLWPKQSWIPTSVQLPGSEKAVLVYERENRNIFTAIYVDGRWQTFDVHNPIWMDETIYGDIVAWMPLPEPYRGEE